MQTQIPSDTTELVDFLCVVVCGLQSDKNQEREEAAELLPRN